MRFVVRARAGSDGRVSVTLARSLVLGFRVDRVTPTPVRSQAVEAGVEYVFAAEPGNPAAIVIFELQPVQRWLIRGDVSSRDGSLVLTQFIYP